MPNQAIEPTRRPSARFVPTSWDAFTPIAVDTILRRVAHRQRWLNFMRFCIAWFVLGVGFCSGAEPRPGSLHNPAPGILYWSTNYQGPGLYVRAWDTAVSISNGVPTIQLPFTDAPTLHLSVANGFTDDILLQVEPIDDIIGDWTNRRSSTNRADALAPWGVGRGSGHGPAYHKEFYTPLVGYTPRPIAPEAFSPVIPGTRTIQKQLSGAFDGYSEAKRAAIRQIELLVPISLQYVVIGQANLYAVSSKIHLIMEKEQPTSGCSEPSRSSGR